MADSSSKFSLPCNTLSPRHRSFSFFQTSGSRIGAGAKVLPDSESVWSPTSPLDCKLFSNLSNPFSIKSLRPSFQTVHKKQLDCSEVGLRIVSSLVNENKLDDEILRKFQRKNIIHGPRVKTGILNLSKNSRETLAPYLKFSSLPKNYVIPLPSETKIPKSEGVSIDDVSRKKEFCVESEAFASSMTSLPDSSGPFSLINSNQTSNLEINDLCVENTPTIMSLPPATCRSLQLDYSLKTRSSSLPISIDFSNGYVGPLSAREIELSEDYTCIISHGPNPKRTHIFADCILDCQKNDFSEFVKKEGPTFRDSEVSTFSEGSACPHPSDNVLSFCYSCSKKLENEEDIYTHRGEKSFCSFNSRSEEILAEDEDLEKTYANPAENSSDTSYHDFFLTGLHLS